ncbi:hypothetical protein Lal_00022099 [Lupinus albus]|nr:hypothetical protein Lal_00022099 [Lupinus albus]
MEVSIGFMFYYVSAFLHSYNDRIMTVFEPTHDDGAHNGGNIDEIKQYLDCRYISPQSTVERLYFHLPREQHVHFKDHVDIDNILSRANVSEFMFTYRVEANKAYPEGRNIIYAQYVSKFVYIKRNRCWKPQKSVYTIGRLIWVSPCTDEPYYLRMILTVLKGPTSYEDIMTVSDIQPPTFRETCFAMGLLEDDKET